MKVAEKAEPVAVPLAPAAPRKRSRRNLILVATAAVVVAGVFAWWLVHRGLESTDDAQIDADIVSVPVRTGGTIAQVLFTDNQTVKAGEVLAVLDDAEAKARVAQAEANFAQARAAADAAAADAQVVATNAAGAKSIAEAALRGASVGANAARDQIAEAEAALRSAEASYTLAQADHQRNAALFEENAISRAQLDQADAGIRLAASNRDAARARLSALRAGASQADSRISEADARLKQSSDVALLVKQAEARAEAARAQAATAQAALDVARLQLAWTRVVAPADGVVSKRTIAVGQAVATGQTIVQLVPPGRWVTANFKETQIARMHVGQKVRVDADAFPGVELHGEVESFSAATGSRFTLLPPDNASGNFTKVVQRLSVRVRLVDVPSGVVLRPGMSVDVTVDTRS
jgi:membrane fusion protein (multidrug efflux system)